MRDFLVLVGWCAAGVLVVIGAVSGSRAFDRTFRLLGDYSAGPRPYPDQDPAPRGRRH